MRKLLVMLSLLLVVVSLLWIAFLYAMSYADDGQLDLDQSQIDSYRAEKRVYNMVPGRSNDAHNQYLDNQIQRYSNDRDKIINQKYQQQTKPSYQRGDRGKKQ